jgi:hypothetical protein
LFTSAPNFGYKDIQGYQRAMSKGYWSNRRVCTLENSIINKDISSPSIKNYQADPLICHQVRKNSYRVNNLTIWGIGFRHED